MTTNLIYRAAREDSVMQAYWTLADALGTKEWDTGAVDLLPTTKEWKHASITQRCVMLTTWFVGECAAVAVKAEQPVAFVNLVGTND